MDLTQLANLGEFIGGVAVLVTLIYLALQVRQSTALARATAQREISAAFQSDIDRIGQQAAIYQRGMQDFESMSHEDQLRFDVILARIINHLEQSLQMYRQGLETNKNIEAQGTICLAMLQAPGARSYWEKVKPFFGSEARGYLEERLADPSRLPPAFIEELPWHGPDPEAEGGKAS